MIPEVYFVFLRVVLGMGDFVSTRASVKECELVMLLHSRVLIRDQMARRELLCQSANGGLKASLTVK